MYSLFIKFFYPSFLWASLLIIVPVVIHLFYFRRYKPIYFSSISFLQESKKEYDSKNRLKHLLVLLTRIIAFLAIVLAIAQPYIPTRNNVHIGDKLISIYVDNSLSMSGIGENGQLLIDQAKHIAKEIVYHYSDQNQFHITSGTSEPFLDTYYSKEEALLHIDKLSYSPVSLSVESAFHKQKNAAQSFQGETIYYEISDYIASGNWFQPDSGESVYFIPVRHDQLFNQYVDSVWFYAPVQIPGQMNHLMIQLSNKGSISASGRVQLLINDEIKAIKEYEMDPNASLIDTIPVMLHDAGWYKGQISIQDYPLTFDDHYFVAFYVKNVMDVLTIYGEQDDVCKNIFTDIEHIHYTSTTLTHIDYNAIYESDLVILYDIEILHTGLVNTIKEYLVQGGNVFFVPHKNGNIDTYNQLLASLNVGKIQGHQNSNKQVTTLHEKHELVHDIFSESPKNIKLPQVKSSWSFAPDNLHATHPILQFGDGSHYLSSYSIENQGRLYMLFSTLDKEHSDFSQNPIFAPMVYKMAILNSSMSKLSFPIKSSTHVELSNQYLKEGEMLYTLKREGFEQIPKQISYNGNKQFMISSNDVEAGFYELYSENDSLQAAIALNYDRKESNTTDTSFLNSYLSDSLLSNHFILEGNVPSIKENVQLLEEGISLWKLCILLTLVFLGLEIILLRIFPD